MDFTHLDYLKLVVFWILRYLNFMPIKSAKISAFCTMKCSCSWRDSLASLVWASLFCDFCDSCVFGGASLESLDSFASCSLSFASFCAGSVCGEASFDSLK